RLGYLSGQQLPLALREGLRELGYVEGQNLLVEPRDAEGRADRLADLAAELVALPVDVIATGSSLQVSAAMAATSTIPIVNLGGGADLVDLGLVESLARPGGNITGLTSAGTRLYGKRLQLLTEVAAPVARVAILHDGNQAALPDAKMPVPLYEQPARELGLHAWRLDPRGPEELDRA